MKVVHRIETWGDTHHPKVIDLLRILLGIFLVLKGAEFLQNMAYLRDIVVQNRILDTSPTLVEVMVYFIAYAHLVGGTLIFLGLMTRTASIIQLPIVFGAVFFVNIFRSLVNSELWLSIIILGLLIVFSILGSGPLSLDSFISSHMHRDLE